jgi:nickel-dependent lactate racemase
MVIDSTRQVELPYGAGTARLNLPGDRSVAVYAPRELPAVEDGEAEVRRAMAEPIGTAMLGEIVRGRRGAAIVVDDATRAVPTPAMLRPIVEELRRAGLRHEQITVVVATGLHRPLTDREARDALGGLPLRLINHDPHDPSQLVDLGTTSRGTPLKVNRTVVEADMRILTGDVELHQFAGFGGGAKSVLPGICDLQGALATHRRMESPGAGPGRIDDNPIRLDIEEAADRLGVDFAVNVVLGRRREIARAVAGDVHAAFRAGAELVDRTSRVEVPEPVDVVICSPGGFPKDVDLYQSQKAIRSARRIVRQGGSIIAAAECREGHGSELAYRWARQARSPQEIIDRHREEYVMGGHKAYQLAVDVLWAPVYLYCEMPREITEAFFLKSLGDLRQAEAIAARAHSIAVLPRASSTLPLLAGQVSVDF